MLLYAQTARRQNTDDSCHLTSYALLIVTTVIASSSHKFKSVLNL